MLTDGMFTVQSRSVTFRMGDLFTLVPFGDVHRDSSGFSKDKWDEFIDFAKTAINPLYIGMGDYLDSFSTSERTILGNDGLHETTKETLEDMSRRKVLKFAKEIEFMKGRIIGLLGGNHFPSFADGTTGDMLLARHLDTTYLGAASAIRLTFNRRNSKQRAVVDIFAHHGRGAGQTTSGRMAAVEKMQQIIDADIYLQGHNHARGILPLGDRLRLEHGRNGLIVRSRRCWIGRTGSYLRGYVPHQKSYVTDACMVPASLGWISFVLKPHRVCGAKTERLTIDIEARQ